MTFDTPLQYYTEMEKLLCFGCDTFTCVECLFYKKNHCKMVEVGVIFNKIEYVYDFSTTLEEMNVLFYTMKHISNVYCSNENEYNCKNKDCVLHQKGKCIRMLVSSILDGD